MLTQQQAAARQRALEVSILQVAEQGGAALTKVSTIDGGLWRGACPKCGGEKRFTIKENPTTPPYPAWNCNDCRLKGSGNNKTTGVWSDVIALYTWLYDATFEEALMSLGGYNPDTDTERHDARTTSPRRNTPKPSIVKTLTVPVNDIPVAPGDMWQTAGRAYVQFGQSNLWSDRGAAGRDILAARRLTEETARRAGIGYNDTFSMRDPLKWGLDEKEKVSLSQGLIFPCFADGELLSIRTRLDVPHKGNRYYPIVGTKGARPLFNSDTIKPYGIVVMTEGEIDALSIWQAAGYSVGSVATASAGGAHSLRWVTRLVTADLVLLVFDNDDKGQEARAWWGDKLGAKAFEWQPPLAYKDANEFLQNEGDGAVLEWLEDGINAAADNGVNMFTGDKIRAFLA